MFIKQNLKNLLWNLNFLLIPKKIIIEIIQLQRILRKKLKKHLQKKVHRKKIPM